MFSSFCPCVIILGPNEHLHINKGRHHMFRKSVELKEMHERDCHYQLHLEYCDWLKKHERVDKPGKGECVSYAWDWCYIGSTEYVMIVLGGLSGSDMCNCVNI